MAPETTSKEPKKEDLASKGNEPANGPSHEYHAVAHGLRGHLHHPVYQRIKEQALVTIKGQRGGHITEQVRAFSLEGAVTFASAHSRVSGSRSLKNNGWITLATSIVEGINVLEVITADRVVSQVSTEHAYTNGHVPDVTFLGTKFENLRLSGFKIKPKFNFGICGVRPSGTVAYVHEPQFLERAQSQLSRVATGFADLGKDISKFEERMASRSQVDTASSQNKDPEQARKEQNLSILQRHKQLLKKVQDRYSDKQRRTEAVLKSLKPERGVAPTIGGNGGGGSQKTVVTCSLIDEIENIEKLMEAIPGLFAVGHVLFVPEFGIVALGEIEVESNSVYNDNYFTLKMLDMDLGCVGDGKVVTALAATNGRHNP